MPRWFDRQCEELDRALEAGEITNEDYRREMRELNAELRDAAQEAASEAYDDYMGF